MPVFRRSDPGAVTPTFGPTSGGATGMIGILLSVVVIVTEFTDGSGPDWSLVVGAVLFSAICWALLLRPRVVLRPDELLLRNVVSDYRIPYARIESFEVRTVSTAMVGDTKYLGLGVTRTRKAMTSPLRSSGGGGMGLFRGLTVPEPATSPNRPSTNAADLVVQLVTDRIRAAAPTAVPVRRVPAWPEIAGLTLLVALLVVTIVV